MAFACKYDEAIADGSSWGRWCRRTSWKRRLHERLPGRLLERRATTEMRGGKALCARQLALSGPGWALVVDEFRDGVERAHRLSRLSAPAQVGDARIDRMRLSLAFRIAAARSASDGATVTACAPSTDGRSSLLNVRFRTSAMSGSVCGTFARNSYACCVAAMLERVFTYAAATSSKAVRTPPVWRMRKPCSRRVRPRPMRRAASRSVFWQTTRTPVGATHSSRLPPWPLITSM